VKVVKTPIRAPKANAFAERWVRTVRTECLDWMLVLGRRHLERILRTYTSHYNARRPHRGLDLRMPDTRPDQVCQPAGCLPLRRRDVLGGLIHEYELAADLDRRFMWPSGLARLQVRYPEIPVVFTDSRKFAEEWTYRFLAAAFSDAESGDPVAERR
jgi:hypothetical protein